MQAFPVAPSRLMQNRLGLSRLATVSPWPTLAPAKAKVLVETVQPTPPRSLSPGKAQVNGALGLDPSTGPGPRLKSPKPAWGSEIPVPGERPGRPVAPGA